MALRKGLSVEANAGCMGGGSEDFELNLFLLILIMSSEQNHDSPFDDGLKAAAISWYVLSVRTVTFSGFRETKLPFDFLFPFWFGGATTWVFHINFVSLVCQVGRRYFMQDIQSGAHE